MEEQVRKIDLKTLPEPVADPDPDPEPAAEARDGEDEKAKSFPRLA